MNDAFLDNFMQAAQAITGAERCIAFDKALTVQTSHNIDAALLTDESFITAVKAAAQDAIDQRQAIITNNLITDPEDAPNTNIHLTDLRMVVTLPVPGRGAIYFDQHIRQGVFERETVDKLALMAKRAIATGQTDMTRDELVAFYETL